MDSLELVYVAYKKLKQYIYYEQLDIFLKEKIAEFECDETFESNLKIISKIINDISVGLSDTAEINSLLDKISFNLIPKSLESFPKSCFNNNYITNDDSSEEYNLNGFNYFINAPIEIHLLCVVWVMKVGVCLDSELSNNCYWYRINERLKKPNDKSSHLFELYHKKYAEWRNNALQKAEDLLDNEKKDVAVLSLDLKQFFYCTHPDFDALISYIQSKYGDKSFYNDESIFAETITRIIEKIHQSYQSVIDQYYFSYSHCHIERNPHRYIVPIGLVSSGLICNWHLRMFDNDVEKVLNPAYYGRYADDILIVISNPDIDKSKKDKDYIIDDFIEKYFLKTSLLKKQEKNGNKYYCLCCDENLCMQQDKLFLHYYSSDQSHAVLKKFKQKIMENSSAFSLLPQDELDLYIENAAYNLNYFGSTNKFRSIIGFEENLTEFSIKLSKINQTVKQCDLEKDILKQMSDQIFKFYNGSNFINFCRTWEKYFTFLIISGQYSDCAKFYYTIQSVICKISQFRPEVEKECDIEKSILILSRQREDLKRYLDISLSMALSILGSDIQSYVFYHKNEGRKKTISSKGLNAKIRELKNIASLLRGSNLTRHSNIIYPLINYTDYEGSFIDFDKVEKYLTTVSINFDEDNKKIKYSPRFIHYDEFYLFNFIQQQIQNGNINMVDIKNKYINISHLHDDTIPIYINQREFGLYKPELKETSEDKNSKILSYHIVISRNDSNNHKNDETIRIGIANIKVKDDYISSSYKPSKKPMMVIERQNELFQLLNLAKNESCDLFILPELSIPHRWLPFMVQYARNHQIGLIFGMEYWKNQTDNSAYNFIVAALPIISEDKYKTCFPIIRCKNHYSPHEKIELIRSHLKIPEINQYRYDLIKWKNTQFSIYNCYELADINHRSLFKSELDFLVACVLNRDILYFSSIIESVVKDLHCYAIQVNCSDYGDSRVVQPTNSENLNLIRVTGGDNSTILTTNLKIQELRDFQCLGYSETDKHYKPTPPGYDHSKAGKR